MATPDEMRLFALECLRWSDHEAANASQRELMITASPLLPGGWWSIIMLSKRYR